MFSCVRSAATANVALRLLASAQLLATWSASADVLALSSVEYNLSAVRRQSSNQPTAQAALLPLRLLVLPPCSSTQGSSIRTCTLSAPPQGLFRPNR